MVFNEKKLTKLIEQAVTNALTVEMTMEKVRDEKTGQPLAKKELIKEKVFLPSFLVQVLSQNEGAFRGLQEQTCKQSGKVDDLKTKVDAIGNVLLQTENSLKELAGLSDNVKQVMFCGQHNQALPKYIEVRDDQGNN
jgi:hypothetical protein